MICPKCGMETSVYVAIGGVKLCVPCYLEQESPNKHKELSKLFDAVVAYETDRENPETQTRLREQKNFCLVRWHQETMRIIKDAYRYLAKRQGY